MTVVTASVELLVWQSPGPDGVSEPEEEDVFEHLDGGEERVQLGALYLLPPDGHLAHRQLQHLAHLNIATVTFWTKVIVPQLCRVMSTYLQHLHIKSPSFNMKCLEYLPSGVSLQ